MKKFITLALAMCLSSISYSQSIKGDVNEDGVVDISDVNAVINIICGQKEDTADPHEYVDLGLTSGTLWATCNIGAENPEDAGLYFAWGETTGYTSDTSDGRSFNWTNYKWCNGSETTMTKYCTSSSYGTVDNKTELDSDDDAATVNWGKDWQIPSMTQQDELRTDCTWTWDSTKKGYTVKSMTNSNSIFLPASGYRSKARLDGVGSCGYYWSRSLTSHYSSGAYCIGFGSDIQNRSGISRDSGFSVRPVRVQK